MAFKGVWKLYFTFYVFHSLSHCRSSSLSPDDFPSYFIHQIQAIRRKVLPAPTLAFIHFPAPESICSALHPVTMNWSHSYPRPAPSLLHQILSVFLTPSCLNIPPTMLPAFFWSSIFPFLLDHSHQHQICCNFSHLKINKTKTQTHLLSYPPPVLATTTFPCPYRKAPQKSCPFSCSDSSTSISWVVFR